MKLPVYFTRNMALEGIEEKDYIVFGKDKTEGKKTFFRLPISEIQKLEKGLLQNSNYYEILPPNFPAKPYFDLEMEYSGLSYETCEKNTDLFIDWIIKDIKNKYDVESLSYDIILPINNLLPKPPNVFSTSLPTSFSTTAAGGRTCRTRIGGMGRGNTALTMGADLGCARATAISFRLSILFKFIASSTLKFFKNVSLSGSVTNCISEAKNRLDFLTAFGLFIFC
jgi:hypothetical protein